MPWLVWVSATLGLNLVLGWAGQFHFGYAAIMGIGAYATVHAVRNGMPWEIAVVLGGLMASVVGIAFAFAALRVKGLYLALTTLALQFVMDWVISHVPAISGGVGATLQAPAMQLLGQPVRSEAVLYLVALGWCLVVTMFMLNLRRTALGRALVAVREKDFAAAVIGVHAFHYKLVAFATSSFIGGVSGAILIFTFYHAVTPEQFAVERVDPGAGDGDRGRAGQHHRQLVRGRLHPAATGADQRIGRLACAVGRGAGQHRDASSRAVCGVRRTHHRLLADRADGPRQALRQRAQLPAGVAVRVRAQMTTAPTMNTPPAAAMLSLNNVEVIYDHIALAVKAASLEIPSGGMVALLGANGAGKSTLLKSISGLLKPERGEVTRGEVRFLGRKIDRAGAADARARSASRRYSRGGACSDTSRPTRTWWRHRPCAAAAQTCSATRAGVRLLSAPARARARRRPAISRAASSRCWRSAAR